MREFIGYKLRVEMESLGMVEGILVHEDKSFLLIKEEDEKIHRYAKGKVVGFVPMDHEPVNYVPFHVLRCFNKSTGCPGVQFIQEGAGIKSTDFETFMAPCPMRCETCEYGTKGELRTVDGDFLKSVFKDVLFGDYPEKEVQSGGSERTDDEAGDSQSEG